MKIKNKLMENIEKNFPTITNDMRTLTKGINSNHKGATFKEFLMSFTPWMVISFLLIIITYRIPFFYGKDAYLEAAILEVFSFNLILSLFIFSIFASGLFFIIPAKIILEIVLKITANIYEIFKFIVCLIFWFLLFTVIFYLSLYTIDIFFFFIMYFLASYLLNLTVEIFSSVELIPLIKKLSKQFRILIFIISIFIGLLIYYVAASG